MGQISTLVQWKSEGQKKNIKFKNQMPGLDHAQFIIDPYGCWIENYHTVLGILVDIMITMMAILSLCVYVTSLWVPCRQGST